MRTALPLADERAVRRSNLGSNTLEDVRRTRLAEQHASLKQASARYRRELKRLLSARDLKRAGDIVEGLKKEFRENLKVRGDANKWEAQRKEFRSRLNRRLVRALPRFRDVRTLQRAYRREAQKLVVKWHDDLPPLDGIKVDDFPPDATIFAPPFPLVDTEVIEIADDSVGVSNRSFVLPESGQLMLDADIDDNQDTPLITGALGLGFPNVVLVFVSCGVSYTTPRAGRVRVTAELRNFYNYTLLSLTDNWGFSSGTLRCSYTLFASVALPSQESAPSVLLFSKKLTSDGDNISAVMPDIDQTAPLFIDVITDHTFNQGLPLWVMVGSTVGMTSDLDDMHSHVRSQLWWQVNRIGVSVVD